MAPSILGVGLPASHSLVPDAIRPNIQKALDDMDDTMKSSPYEWEMLYLTPETPFDQLTSKLREKNWDVVLVGSMSPPAAYIDQGLARLTDDCLYRGRSDHGSITSFL